jgi:putative RNA 2'-phosphotransferase
LNSRTERLSKYLSYLLRHNPSSLGLNIDEDGFVQLDRLVSAIQTKKEWNWVTRNDIMNIQRDSDKRRFEILRDKIRAIYGHTFSKRIHRDPVVPPKILYHGTSRDNLQSILRNGILPMRRQYVHLSISVDEAHSVGLRRDQNPIILRVLAFEAYNSGVRFFQAGSLFLSEPIPPRFIDLERP